MEGLLYSLWQVGASPGTASVPGTAIGSRAGREVSRCDERQHVSIPLSGAGCCLLRELQPCVVHGAVLHVPHRRVSAQVEPGAVAGLACPSLSNAWFQETRKLAGPLIGQTMAVWGVTPPGYVPRLS